MAPTHFYPLLAGTSTASQVEATVVRHLTNASRFAVWPSASPPDPAPPPAAARPITQWAAGQNHSLCVRAACNWRHRSHLKEISYEGMGLAAPPTDEPGIGLYVFACPGGVDGLDVDEVLAPLEWQPSVGHCRATSDEPELWVLPRRSRPELVELQLWYSAAAGDHWPLASEASKIAAAAAGMHRWLLWALSGLPPGHRMPRVFTHCHRSQRMITRILNRTTGVVASGRQCCRLCIGPSGSTPMCLSPPAQLMAWWCSQKRCCCTNGAVVKAWADLAWKVPVDTSTRISMLTPPRVTGTPRSRSRCTPGVRWLASSGFSTMGSMSLSRKLCLHSLYSGVFRIVNCPRVLGLFRGLTRASLFIQES